MPTFDGAGPAKVNTSRMSRSGRRRLPERAPATIPKAPGRRRRSGPCEEAPDTLRAAAEVSESGKPKAPPSLLHSGRKQVAPLSLDDITCEVVSVPSPSQSPIRTRAFSSKRESPVLSSTSLTDHTSGYGSAVSRSEASPSSPTRRGRFGSNSRDEAPKVSKQIRELGRDLHRIRDQWKMARNEAAEVAAILESESDTLKREIREHFRKLQATLTAREAVMLREADTAADKRKKPVTRHIAQLERLIMDSKAVIRQSRADVGTGDPELRATLATRIGVEARLREALEAEGRAICTAACETAICFETVAAATVLTGASGLAPVIATYSRVAVHQPPPR